ncbi:hypothetical protein SAY87_027797 [Trapa incisa]|uniref:Uncharacterized protein n=1 Tax=Trapa incisa TaxID=236973 RepID=A0AAN7PKW0_9MYRT|nr:hypothetical protein SAY87_027797 [Trapa incisa]
MELIPELPDDLARDASLGSPARSSRPSGRSAEDGRRRSGRRPFSRNGDPPDRARFWPRPAPTPPYVPAHPSKCSPLSVSSPSSSL